MYAHARGKEQRKAERKHGDTEGHCMTPGSRYARHPGVGHKKKANRTNGTGIKQYGHIQGKKIQTEKRQRKGYKKNNGTVKEQTHKKGERRQAVQKTRSKPQPNKPVKGRRTLY